MSAAGFTHVLQFGIEIEMAVVPNELGLEALKTFEFEDSEEAHRPDLQGGRRDDNREAVCDQLRTAFFEGDIAVNPYVEPDETPDYSKWTVDPDPTILE